MFFDKSSSMDGMTQPTEDVRPPFREALFWFGALSALFMIVYGGCNWITSQRSDVGTFYFAWEKHIPLVPVFIIPYMSIDLFFAGSMFLCGSRRELHLLAKRIATAICVAGVFFLLFPLQLGVTRPTVSGPFAPIFHFLWAFDQPYNLAPSLHIALRSILWFVYVAHTFGLLRGAVRFWFMLIGISTLLTWQHHVFDVVTGQLLALFCFYAFPATAIMSAEAGTWLRRGTQNQRLSVIYGSLAAICFVAAVMIGSWAWLLLWPTFALAVIAIGYRVGSTDVFRKRAGQIPLTAWILLDPYLLGSWISFLYHRRKAPAFVQAAPGIYLGRHLNGREARELRKQGIVAVLDLTSEFSRCKELRGLPYRNVPMLDLTTPSREHIAHCVAFIREHEAAGAVYIHCALGYSRSVCIAAAYLLQTGQAASPEAAVEMLSRARPQLVLRRDTMAILQQYHTSGGANQHE